MWQGEVRCAKVLQGMARGGKVFEHYLDFIRTFKQSKKQAENGLQLRSGYHGLSWTVMDDLH